MHRLKAAETMAVVARDDEVVSIDVFSIPASETACSGERAIAALREIAQFDRDFIAGAVHVSLPPWRQPLAWLPGAVPLRRRFIAIYARWRAEGRRLGIAGSAPGREWLADLSQHSAEASQTLATPEASLYRPALLDASGETKSEPQSGPVIDAANPRAQFINVFQTTPDRQARLLAETTAIMPVATAHPGYLRTALHLSLDGRRLVNYGQYRELRQIRGMYFHLETARRFAAILLRDVTRPSILFGRRWNWRGRPLGTPPRLRCYDVAAVVHARPAP